MYLGHVSLTFLLCRLQTIFDDFPIDNVPYGVDIVRTYIAVTVQK